MPSISETSVSEISLSPACSVMIIFFLVDRSSTQGPPSQRCDLVQSPEWASGSAPTARGRGLPTVNDISREASADGRQEPEQKLNSQDQLGRSRVLVFGGGLRVVPVRSWLTLDDGHSPWVMAQCGGLQSCGSESRTGRRQQADPSRSGVAGRGRSRCHCIVRNRPSESVAHS